VAAAGELVVRLRRVKMPDDFDERSFRLDPDAKSFHLTGYRWRDAPVLVVCLVLSLSLLTGFNFLFSLLPRDAALVIFGISVGYLVGVWIGERRAVARILPRSGAELPQRRELSDRVRGIACDPGRKLEAIKVYCEESGAGLGEATEVVEAYINRVR
jgi:hypothetical protein